MLQEELLFQQNKLCKFFFSIFRCGSPENRQTPVGSTGESNSPSFRNTVESCPPGQRFSLRLRTCISRFSGGLRSASRVQAQTSDCPKGKIYVPSIDLCLDAIKPQKTSSLKSDSLLSDGSKTKVQAFSNKAFSEIDCKPGEIYNSEVSLCMKFKPSNNKKLLSLSLVKEDPKKSLNIQSFVSQTASDCKRGEIWVSEISSCVNIEEKPTLHSASLIRSSRPIRNPSSSKDCGQGEIFVSEIGICQPVSPPHNKKPLSSDSLVHDKAPAVAVQDLTICPVGKIFVSELNVCMPFNSNRNKPSVPASASQVKEPEKLEIISFASTFTKVDCKPGQIYVSEIDICM